MKESEELLPLIEWWEKDGKQTVTWLVIAGAIVGGIYGFKAWRQNQREKASDALLTSVTVEDLETAQTSFGNAKVGPAIRLRLAKAYFDDEKYDEALGLYEQLIGQAPDGFEDVPEVGVAQCLEAKGDFAAAAAKYDAFSEAKPKSYLVSAAQMGAARAYAQAGDKEKALARLAAMKTAYADDEAVLAQVKSCEELVQRWEKPAPAPEAPKEEPAAETSASGAE